MKEMVGGCCVCSDERGWPENPLVYCDGQNCTVAVHQACYGIVTVPTGPWYCRKCESQERSARVRCELCPSRDGALKKTDNAGWAHVVCALYIPEVRFGNVTTMEPIILQLIPPERYAKTCYICQDIGKVSRSTVGACMQCNKSGCKQQFHVTCAQALGLLCEEAGNYLDNVKYCGYCQHHYSKLKKGGNVKTIPPYKPISHDSSSSISSPEKEVEGNITASASSTSATSIKITTNLSATATSAGMSSSVSQSNSSSSSKQRKSSSASKPSSIGNQSSSSVSGGVTGSSSSGNTAVNQSSSSSSSSNKQSSGTSKDKDKHSSKNVNKMSSSSKNQDKEKDTVTTNSSSSSRGDKSSSKSSKNSSSKESSNSTSNTNSGTSTTNIGSNTNVHASEYSGNNLSMSASTPSGHSNNSNVSSQNQNISNSAQTKDNSGQKFTSSSANDTVTTDSGFGSNTTSNTNNEPTAVTTNTTSSSTTKSSSNSSSKKRKAEASKAPPPAEPVDGNGSSFRDIIKDVSVTLIPLPIEKSESSGEQEKAAKKPKTESSNQSNQQSSHDLHQSGALQGSNLSSSSTATSSIHLKNPALSSIKEENRLRAQSPYQHSSNSNASASQVNMGHSNTGSTQLLSSTIPTSISSSQPSSVHNSNNNSTSISSNINSSNNSSSGSTPSLYVSVPLSTANVPGVNLPSSASSGSTSGTGNSGHNSINNSNLSGTSNLSSGNSTSGGGIGGKQSPRVGGGFPSSAQQQSQQQHSSSNSIISNEYKNLISGNSSSGGGSGSNSNNIASSSATTSGSGGNSTNTNSAMQNTSSVIQPNTSPIGSTTNPNLSGSNEGVNLTIKYEKQNFRVSKLQQEQDSGPARRSRTPDSGNFSNTSLSQNSLSTSTSSLNNGGLKFSYEPQCGSSGGNQRIPAQTPPLIDTNIGAIIKDSPQSSPNSETGSTVSRKRGRKSVEIRNNNISASSNNGPIPMVIDTKLDSIKQENKVFSNVNGTATTTSGTTPASSTSTNSSNPAHHMLGNQINPNSSMAQKMNDMVHMEIQDHNLHSQENGPHLVGVPFPGKRTSSLSQNPPSSNTNPLASMLTGTATSTPSGNTPQSLEQLLERQWEQGSQFLMEQAQHFDIASLLSCLHQLRTENMRLEEHVNSLIARRDHLLAVNARLAIPLTTLNPTNQVTAKKRRS